MDANHASANLNANVVVVVGAKMKNNECTIYFKSKKRIVQTIYKNKKGWMQKSAKGNFFHDRGTGFISYPASSCWEKQSDYRSKSEK